MAAPFEWPETNKMSGLSALNFVKVADMSDKSAGNLSSITIFILYFFATSRTPARTSSEKPSFSNAMPIRRSDGDLPSSLERFAIRSSTGAR